MIAFDYFQQAVSALRERKFSMIIDKTTDLSTLKQLAILVICFDMESFASKYYLLDMVEIVDGIAQRIYSAVKQVFSDLHTPWKTLFATHRTQQMSCSGNNMQSALCFKRRSTEYPNVSTSNIWYPRMLL